MDSSWLENGYKILTSPLVPIKGSWLDALAVLAIFMALYLPVILFLKLKRYRIARTFNQLISAVVFVLFYHICFCAIRNGIYGISLIGTDDLSAFILLIPGVLILVFSMSVGRIFCGWVCPLGCLQDFTAWISKPLRKRKIFLMILAWLIMFWYVIDLYLNRPQAQFISELAPALFVFYMLVVLNIYILVPAAAGFLGKLRYALLVFWVFLILIDVYVVSPWCVMQGGEFYYSWLGSLLAVLAAAMLVPRFWCRFICPMGALLGIFNKVSAIKLEKNPIPSDSESECRANCLMGAIEDNGRKERKCIYCGRCIEKDYYRKEFRV
ncbi:MAG: 4Fe-4S binding protein [Candidatus Izemoplasmatales bacterium]|nr:4Fe-4S binding protein [Candidatus Izemoplasmatales bacterium]